ncbi:MAG: septal ring lytic transglycosylase RlpA family protein [Gammaproteobacteria bacterium]|nr:septal ring lytic transglycosylase RlpA family protein [Gammaproteobacteria bacterium]
MQARLPLLAISLLALAACGGSNVKRDGPPSGSSRIPGQAGDVTPRPEARSRYGNGPVYEVLGKRYTVMPSSLGYQERGVASWYGKKFHGRLTSNRETYDMHAMTAAHKTLPLPTYVRVRNLRNNKSIVVRVNDRGPFVHNRIIDLSYAAAMKLDMIKDGTSMVEVTAISFDQPSGDRPTRSSTPPPAAQPEAVAEQPQPVENQVYVQVGAFGDRANAERRLGVLSVAGIRGAFIHEERLPDSVLYRVRIGPVADVVQYDIIVEELDGIGITDPYLITE